MKSLLILISIFFVVSIVSETRANEKRFRHFTATEGLSYNTILDIEQDQEGFLWIATGEGLNRYDSNGFKQYYSGKDPNTIPSNDIKALMMSKQGVLFIGTSEGLCIYNPEYDNFTSILYNKQSLGRINDILEKRNGKIIINSETGTYVTANCGEILERLPLENNLIQIQEDLQGNLWSFKRQRLFCFNERGELLNLFHVNPSGLPNFIPTAILTIKIDSHGKLWIGTFKDGPILFEPEKKRFKSIPLKVPFSSSHPMYFVHDIEEDRDGKFWIGTESGLFIYDPVKEDFEHYQQSHDRSLLSLNDNAIYKVFRSRENIMWIGTYFGGLNYWEPFESPFHQIQPGIKTMELKGKALSQMIEGPDDQIWIATEDAGIAIYNPRDHSFRHLLNNPDPQNAQIRNNVHALTIDHERNVWSGNFNGGIHKINPKTFQITNFSHNDNDPSSLVNNFVFSLYVDSDDLLWVGTMDGIDCFETKNHKINHFKPEIFKGSHVYDIFQDQQNNYWFCTYRSGLYFFNKRENKVIRYQKDSTRNLNNNSFISHCIDSKGKLWFGTRDGGLVFFDPATGKFRTYDKNDGLPNNTIYGILEDGQNNLWLSSNKGITKFNYNTGKIQHFTVDHGLVGNQFNFKSFLKTKEGTMYFGAVNGLCYFYPDQIKNNESQPKIYFTNLKLFNEPVKPSDHTLLKKDINFTDKITLNYDQNVISFDFIALDYYSKGKNNFYYKMDGFESGWQTAGNQRSITYTNLPPGHYNFLIKATNNYDFPNQLTRSIKITVLPPFWRTPWAIIIYILILVVILLLFVRFNEIRHKEKLAINIEKIEKEKLQELHQHKMNFFTYISHEFKTPLTIIIASIDSFFSGDNLSNEIKERLTLIKRNALRLQFLLNQLMDFRKVETDHATLNLQRGDLMRFIKEIFIAFTPLFDRKELKSTFVSQTDSLLSNFDQDKTEKIVSNLLSNAYKYTPEHGSITLKVETVEENNLFWLILKFSNSGKGLTELQKSEIFKLFYKVEDHPNDYQGSGIGLTLTQSLVKFLNGTIAVESEVDKGTSFIVKLPVSKSIETGDDEIAPVDRSFTENLLLQLAGEESNHDHKESVSDFEILIVEDNKDLLNFLSDHFGKKYKVRTVSNGLEALKSIEKNIPDLVVTDLMMPQMNGISLCKELKSNFNYCHVPVIMLTAKTDSMLESLESGADIYMPKPFQISELDLYIKNILKSKSNLKRHFIQFGNMAVQHPVKNRDQQFIEKITAVILKNIDNSDFEVSTITRELGIGRTLLHTKLKQILDLSATEFINTIRLREAQKLMIEKPDLNMSEVAYRVGFSDPNYFSRTFKKNYNISPTDFRNNKGAELEIKN
jgi:ligand-binding sensor domain-containing protein/signal transduction histidine kinase/DNA-binding response OmpR family regulator